MPCGLLLSLEGPATGQWETSKTGMIWHGCSTRRGGFYLQRNRDLCPFCNERIPDDVRGEVPYALAYQAMLKS